MRAMGKRASRILLLVAGTLAAGSCVDEDVVFDDRPIYQGVAEAAGGFVGYADPSDDEKLTFCGACHVELQGRWEQTAHADAWAGLQSSDHAQDFCEACHTVNSLGNVVAEPASGEAVGGHMALQTEDGRYLDVQCESCHGPGLDHVLAPGAGNVPLAPATVGADLSFGCGECHQGAHHPFVEEWQNSPHASVEVSASIVQPECRSCHTGEGSMLRLGVTADYLEKDALLASDSENMQITCAVCHDPHDDQFEGQLRFPAGGVAVEQTLCAQCHDRHARPDTEGVQEWLTPHSPETGLLAGTAGWFPAGAPIAPGAETGPHGGASNARMCASCHVVEYSTTDPLTDETVYSAGHGFRAAPCVGSDGLPSGRIGCALTVEARSFQGCTECHPSEAAAAETLRSTTLELATLVVNLQRMLVAVDPNLSGAGGEIDAEDRRFTVAEGAFFNLTLAVHGGGFPGGTERLQIALAATATHNPDLIRTLLTESIDAVAATYGVSAAPVTGAATPTER